MSLAVSGTAITFPDATTQTTSPFPGGFAFRNRIINGAMMIDQRNAGASVNINTSDLFIVDRFKGYSDLANMTGQRTQSSVPNGFTYAVVATVGTGASPTSGQISRLVQVIEGFNFGDLNWGSANAQPITLSFWVRSSVVGTHSGALTNSAGNRSYPYTFTVNSANTWENKSITIAGDTTGTWLTDSGAGVSVKFNLGTGTTYLGSAGSWAASNLFGATGSVQLAATSGATFYITGVQLEKNTVATPFDYRPYGTELALCQRYYEYGYSFGPSSVSGIAPIATLQYLVEKRATPSISVTANTSVSGSAAGTSYYSTAGQAYSPDTRKFVLYGVTSGSIGAAWTSSAEL